MEIIYVTTNAPKVQSLQRSLAPHGITVVQEPLDIPEPRSSDVREIAHVKATYAFERLKKPLVVLDAGFYIPSIGGFPRAFVNFALETVGLDGILRLADGKDRSCEFRDCLVYTDGQRTVDFIGHVEGTLAMEQRGTVQAHHWSPLSLIFIPKGYTRTLAELTFHEYVHWTTKVRDTYSVGQQFAQWHLENH